ncbi:MAG: restriction endonuclease subunit S [Candidatus Thiodiazotropha lotti]|nr:restriction endonuclease subunit S [Candidatus Thiodiazotropha lotti]MCW4216736.1 restriction endonuclease subunit S [Candidatus Thiodiazotropha lotti]
MTSTKKITDFVSFNPKRTIKKGETKPFVEMAALPVDSRDISEIGSRTYKGGGSRFQDGDTLFARITPCLENGKTAKTSGLGDGVIAHGSTEFIVLAAKEPEYDEDYVYYLARMPEFRSYAQSRMEGTSGRQRVSWQSLAEFEFDFPEKEDRKEIGRILKSIDDKIQVNNQLNQTLEQIAQAIFKSWFVDFEPVKAKIAVLEAGGTAEQAELAAMSAISAKDEAALQQLQAEQPDAYAELAQTAALFPSAMEESELGEIPAGWDLSYLKSCTTELRRGISPKYTEEGGVRVINQKCIRNHTVDFTLARRNDPSKRKIEGREIEVGDVLVNSTGVGTLGRLAPVRYLDETTVVDSHVTVVRADTGKISKSFLSGLMIVNESFIEASGAGSTGQTELRKQVLEDIRFTRPSPEIDSKYDLIVNHMSSQIAELEKQRSTLASTRDSLLPKLLAGDLPLTITDEELA